MRASRSPPLSLLLTDTFVVIPFTCRDVRDVARYAEGRGSARASHRGASRIAACTSCFPFEPTRRVLSTSLLRTIKRESESNPPTLVQLRDRRARASHGSLHLPSFTLFAVRSTGKFPFQFTGTASPATMTRNAVRSPRWKRILEPFDPTSPRSFDVRSRSSCSAARIIPAP